ncbi:MAG: DUF432 domain-containing protein [Spirochaetaceae bacterium]|nr:DUF432 domain-containing protein [Spirochaetaceae bacterium]
MKNTDRGIFIPWGEIKFSSNLFEQKFEENKILRLEKREKEVRSYFGAEEVREYTSRFILDREHHLYLNPSLPDLPVVIKPPVELSILPGCSLKTYVEIPLVLELAYGSIKKKQVLQEYPVKSLSRSWFGDPDSGEIAYYLESPMEFDNKTINPDSCCIQCPVTITNKSSQLLSLERMILRVPYLTLYKGKNSLYSNRTRITYRGQDQVSQIVIQKNPPEVNEELKILSLPRQAIDSGLLRKSFYFIKTLYEG